MGNTFLSGQHEYRQHGNKVIRLCDNQVMAQPRTGDTEICRHCQPAFQRLRSGGGLFATLVRGWGWTRSN